MTFYDYTPNGYQIPQIDVSHAQPLPPMPHIKNQWFLPEERQLIRAGYIGKGYVAEEVASLLGEALDFSVANQYICMAAEGRQSYIACAVTGLLLPDETFLSFERLLTRAVPSVFRQQFDAAPLEQKYEMILDTFNAVCHMDFSAPLFEMVALDCLTANEGRSFANFGAIYNRKTDRYRPMPLFDFGRALFTHAVCFKDASLFTCINRLSGYPFHVDLQKAYFTACHVLNRSVCGSLDLENTAFPSEIAVAYVKSVGEAMGLCVTGAPQFIQ